jgi:uncharacterized membrane protein (DUF2068 family)
MHRPFGLKAIIALQIVQAFGSFVYIGLLVASDPLLQAQLLDVPLTVDAVAPTGVLITAGLIAVVGLTRLIAAIGLWRLRQWAWLLTMVQMAVAMTIDAVAYFRGHPSYFSMMLNVVMVFYLNQREVIERFETRSAGKAS